MHFVVDIAGEDCAMLAMHLACRLGCVGQPMAVGAVRHKDSATHRLGNCEAPTAQWRWCPANKIKKLGKSEQ